MTRRQLVQLVVVLVLLLSGITTGELADFSKQLRTGTIADATPTPPPAPNGFVYVAKVSDGDTIELSDGTRVRYIGVDTPETVHPSKPVQCYGPEASAYNHVLVEHQFVRLVRDISDTDTYGRLLRYIYLADGTLVNLALVTGGYARAKPYPPDIAHALEFQEAQNIAQTTGVGLWGACK